MKRFPLCLGLGIASILAAISLISMASAPSGMRWLGDTIQNPSDAAVYLSYLRQGADGGFLLHNLYAVEPHAARFDAFWSTAGLMTRFGLSPLAVYELLRIVFTVVLAFAVYGAARSLTSNETDRRLATVLAFCGAGTGWLYTVVIGLTHSWTAKTSGAMDVASEFSIAPTLLTGAHMILSFALLLTGLRLVWRSFSERRARDPLLAGLCCGLLFLFHPYFVPLIGLFTLLAIAFHVKKLPIKTIILRGGAIALSLLPAAAIYVPLAFDPVFRTHHLEVNRLPLIPWPSWIATLFPFAVALVWRSVKKVRLAPQERWLVAWLVAAVACVLLPFPWKRKFTEGLGVALVFLSLPAWVAVREWIRSTSASKAGTWLLSGVFLLGAALSPLNLLASQLSWISVSGRAEYFYRPEVLFEAWEYLRVAASPESVILTDDLWSNLWTPAYAGRATWVAHDHETPDFQAKRAAYRELLSTTDPAESKRSLHTAGITHFVTTSATSTSRFAGLLSPEWTITFQKDTVAVWKPTP